MNLSDINRRFAQIGLAVQLDAPAAEQLKRATSRKNLLDALARVEQSNDAGARAYLEKRLRAAGYPTWSGKNLAVTLIRAAGPQKAAGN